MEISCARLIRLRVCLYIITGCRARSSGTPALSWKRFLERFVTLVAPEATREGNHERPVIGPLGKLSANISSLALGDAPELATAER